MPRTPEEQREYERTRKRAQRQARRDRMLRRRRDDERIEEAARPKVPTLREREDWLYENNEEYRRSVDEMRAKRAERETAA